MNKELIDENYVLCSKCECNPCECDNKIVEDVLKDNAWVSNSKMYAISEKNLKKLILKALKADRQRIIKRAEKLKHTDCNCLNEAGEMCLECAGNWDIDKMIKIIKEG